MPNMFMVNENNFCWTWSNMHTDIHVLIHVYIQTDRRTDVYAYRQTERKTDIYAYRQTERKKTDRQTYVQTYTFVQ